MLFGLIWCCGVGVVGVEGEGSNGVLRINLINNVCDSVFEMSYENSENGYKIVFDFWDMSESVERSK